MEKGCLLGDVLEGDLVVGHLVDLASVTDGGLDADTVNRILNDVVVKGDGVDGVVRATTNRADGQAVTARAETVLEGDALQVESADGHEESRDGTYSPRVDSNAVILVVDLSAVDDNVVAGADVEAISVVAKAASVTSGVVNGHVGDGKSITARNAHGLNRGVLDRDAGNGRVSETVEREELR